MVLDFLFCWATPIMQIYKIFIKYLKKIKQQQNTDLKKKNFVSTYLYGSKNLVNYINNVIMESLAEIEKQHFLRF